MHKETIVVVLAKAGKRNEVRELGKIANTSAAVKTLVAKLARNDYRVRESPRRPNRVQARASSRRHNPCVTQVLTELFRCAASLEHCHKGQMMPIVHKCPWRRTLFGKDQVRRGEPAWMCPTTRVSALEVQTFREHLIGPIEREPERTSWLQAVRECNRKGAISWRLR